MEFDYSGRDMEGKLGSRLLNFFILRSTGHEILTPHN